MKEANEREPNRTEMTIYWAVDILSTLAKQGSVTKREVLDCIKALEDEL